MDTRNWKHWGFGGLCTIIGALIGLVPSCLNSDKNYEKGYADGYNTGAINSRPLGVTVNGQAISNEEFSWDDKLKVVSINYETKANINDPKGNPSNNSTDDTSIVVSGGEEASSEKTLVPIDLFSLTPFTGRYKITKASQSNIKDIYGNYATGYVVSTNPDDYLYYAVYELNGNYTRLEGSIVLSEEIKSRTDLKWWLEFYDDDQLIGKTDILSGGSKLMQFAFDITGVTDLKVLFLSDVGRGFLLIVPEIKIY